MTLAGLALLRQMGVGMSIAGNIAFKENATSVADRGTEAAALADRELGSPATDSLGDGYLSSWGAGVDPATLDRGQPVANARRRPGADRQHDPRHHPAPLRHRAA